MKRAVIASTWVITSLLIFFILDANAPNENDLAPMKLDMELLPSSTLPATSVEYALIKEPRIVPMDTSTIDLSLGVPKLEEKIIYIRNSNFYPDEVEITKGTKVTWKNEDDMDHRITVEDKFDTGVFGKDYSYSYFFNATGTYEFYCVIQPSMRNKIIVK